MAQDLTRTFFEVDAPTCLSLAKFVSVHRSCRCVGHVFVSRTSLCRVKIYGGCGRLTLSLCMCTNSCTVWRAEQMYNPRPKRR